MQRSTATEIRPPPTAAASPAPPAPVPAASPPYLTHGRATVRQYFASHVMGALFPLSAGVMLYGWRALVLVGIVVGSAAAATFVWRRIGARGRQLRYAHTLWLALLLALMLPVHLTSLWPVRAGAGMFPPHWALLPASGIALVIFVWLLGGIGSSRIHPVLILYLLLVVLFQQALVPHRVLQRNAIFNGDALDAPPPEAVNAPKTAWYRAPPLAKYDAYYAEPPSQRLVYFTTGHEPPDRTGLAGLLRDRMPPLEDLILGGAPGPIGLSSAIAVIVGGLFLLYRGVIGYRVPLLVVLSAYVAFLVLPVPVAAAEEAVRWRWLAFLDYQVGWGVAITFVNYELMSGPLLFTAFFLATAPAVRPMARRARVLYAVLIGVAAAAAQLYVSVSFGPYLALIAITLLTPSFDKLFPPRALV